MASGNGELRERKSAKNNETARDVDGKDDHEEKGSGTGLSVLDVLRIIVGLLLLNSMLSYFVTTNSFLWGWKPWFSKPRAVMRWLVSLLRGMTYTSTFPVLRHIVARTSIPYGRPADALQRHGCRSSCLSRTQWHHIRCDRGQPHIRPWWQLPRVCWQRRCSRLHYGLLRRRLHT
jgi:hypothetical protein